MKEFFLRAAADGDRRVLCHREHGAVEEGALLGAFSYDLERIRPLPQQPHELREPPAA